MIYFSLIILSYFRVGKRNYKKVIPMLPPNYLKFKKKKEKIRIESIDNNMVENYV